MHPGDIVAQFRLAWANLKDALTEAGMTPADVVRLNMYTTDVDGFMAKGSHERYRQEGASRSSDGKGASPKLVPEAFPDRLQLNDVRVGRHHGCQQFGEIIGDDLLGVLHGAHHAAASVTVGTGNASSSSSN